MKREILFRGFCPNEKGTQRAVVNGKEYKGEWIVGAATYHSEGYQWLLVDDYTLTETLGTGSYAIIPETVGQWTGLTDKNGKKIFEHDRIKYKCGDIAEVIFTQYGAFVGVIESLSHENIGGVLTEVVGTIFDKEEV